MQNHLNIELHYRLFMNMQMSRIVECSIFFKRRVP